MSDQIVVAMCAARLRANESRSTMRYFRQMLHSIGAQHRQLDEPLYLAASGERAHSFDGGTLPFRVVAVRPDDRAHVWPQFVAYNHAIARARADYGDRWENVWLMFTDADDLWSPNRYTSTLEAVDEGAPHADVYFVVDASSVHNVDEEDAASFVNANDVNVGIADGRISVKVGMRDLQEYTNLCVRSAVVEEFFERYGTLVECAYIDRLFVRFVMTYGGEDGRSLRYEPIGGWSYFYRHHDQSLTSLSRASLGDASERDERVVDMHVIWAYRIASMPVESRDKMHRLVAKIIDAWYERRHNVSFDATVALAFERLNWWYRSVKAIGDDDLSGAVRLVRVALFEDGRVKHSLRTHAPK